MIIEDFEKQAQRLTDVFGPEKWSDARIQTLWKSVSNLDLKWLSEQIDNAVLSPGDRFDFLKAIQAEKNRQAMEKKTLDIIALEKLSDHLRTEEGFQRAMKGFGATSVIEAFNKFRKIEG